MKTIANRHAALRNPERGFRLELGIGMLPNEEYFRHLAHRADGWMFDTVAAEGVTMAQGYCYLTDYRAGLISAAKLDAIEASFERARRLRVKLLLRFAYEHDLAPYGPDEAALLRHMEQLAPLLRRHWDVIYTLQMGWLGLWGEFHSSEHGLETSAAGIAAVVENTLRLLPADRFTMMRRMAYKQAALRQLGVFREITPDIAFSAHPAARIGFFNDGTLSGWNDGQTFNQGGIIADPEERYPYNRPGEPEYDYATREAPFMPVDGELFWNGPDQTGAVTAAMAIRRLRQHHYTTFGLVHGYAALERVPGPGAIDFWRSERIDPEWLRRERLPFGAGYFAGRPVSGFEYIRDHLGYRLEVQKLCYEAHPAAGSEWEVALELVNYGFSTFINPRPVYFVLCRDGRRHVIPTGMDCRQLQPYAPQDPDYTPLRHRVAARLRLPDDLEPGVWQLGLWLPDASERLRHDSDYAVAIAGTACADGVNRLGRVVVSPGARECFAAASWNHVFMQQ